MDVSVTQSVIQERVSRLLFLTVAWIEDISDGLPQRFVNLTTDIEFSLLNSRRPKKI